MKTAAKIRTFGVMVVSTALLLMGAAAHATTITKTLNVWNYDASVGDYGTVTVDDAGGKITFTVAANTDLFSGVPVGKSKTPTLTWDSFFFNVSNPSAIVTSNFLFTGSSSGWSATTKGLNASGFGVFDEHANYSGKTIQNDPLTFYYKNPGALTAADFVQLDDKGYYFSAHLRNIAEPLTETGAALESVFLAATDPSAPVPEPGTMMLLGAGMFGAVIYAKRRKNA